MLSLALAAGLMSGCATEPAQGLPSLAQPEVSAPHARLLMRANVAPNQRFIVLQQQDNNSCTQPVLVGRGTAQQAASPVRLPVGQLVTLEFVIVTPSTKHGCASRWSFTPRAGQTYLVQGATVGTACPAVLVDVTTPDRPSPPPDLLNRVAPGQNCLPLDKSLRLNVNSAIQGGQHNGEAVLNPNATTRDLEGLIKR